MAKKPTVEELLGRLERLEAIQRLEAELLLLKLGPSRVKNEEGPASMSTKEAAQYLGVSVSTLWERAAEGRLPPPLHDGACRLWLRKDLDAYLRSLPRSPAGKGGG